VINNSQASLSLTLLFTGHHFQVSPDHNLATTARAQKPSSGCGTAPLTLYCKSMSFTQQ